MTTPDDPIDTQQTRYIGWHDGKIILILAGCACLLALFLHSSTLDGVGRHGFSHETVGIVGASFFGFMTLLMLLELLTHPKIAISLSPDGLKDARVSPDVIPWSAVSTLRIARYARSPNYLFLRIDPDVMGNMAWSPRGNLTRWWWRWTGRNEVALNTAGLAISFPDLVVLVRRYAIDHGGLREDANAKAPDPSILRRTSAVKQSLISDQLRNSRP
ncbi:hypothetical protein GGD81_003749 [Rhodobium orientis]|uniref:PH domain-containing protein n=1 Tax=Rhodobium orientis TaxID=34017 RepID=A0A327JMV1_9HYPH|nr:hypothetical protein [Rhodobium orientis]MBB4304687.1 hypothetical protein [Rhodobium orientis]MBK5950063.1 hypothetical protein [Rhodobium orientis]RAI27749.1 hypothetical protein CH339_09405 [Rhodobium orientis]